MTDKNTQMRDLKLQLIAAETRLRYEVMNCDLQGAQAALLYKEKLQRKIRRLSKKQGG